VTVITARECRGSIMIAETPEASERDTRSALARKIGPLDKKRLSVTVKAETR